MLTRRQKSVLDFIQSEQREKSITPSTREIQKHFRFASQTSVMQYIAALERKGFLNRHARKARALITPMQKIRITDVPIYGEIPAGMSTLTEQTIEGHVSLDARSANVSKNGQTFALRVRGDSMIGAQIVDLRKLLAERFPQPPFPAATRLATGLSFVDQAIGGGLPRGAITELISPQISAGSASFIQALLQAAHRDRYFLALIDGRDSFDPSALAELGNLRLRNLLWVRCSKALEALKAADLLLRDGNFPLVIIDLVLNPPEELRKIPQTTWYRLQRLVKSSPTACLVLSRHGMVSSAQLKIVLENSWSLETFQEDEATSQLRIRVQRSHLLGQENAIAN